MKVLTNVTEKVYTWITLIAISLGLIVACMFFISIIIGGSTGEDLAVAAGNIMTWAIRLATFAVLAGIINIYLSKRHTLTMNKNVKEKDMVEEESKKNIVS